MSLRRAAWAFASGATIVLSGWVASLLPYGPGGAWAAMTLFPGWFVYTVASKHPLSEPLDVGGRVAVTLGSGIFWTLLAAGVIFLLSQTRRVRRPR